MSFAIPMTKELSRPKCAIYVEIEVTILAKIAHTVEVVDTYLTKKVGTNTLDKRMFVRIMNNGVG